MLSSVLGSVDWAPVFTGIIAAGMGASFFQFATQKRMSFHLLAEQGGIRVAAALALLIAGPAVLVRNSLRGYYIEHRHILFVLAGMLIALMWSWQVGRALVGIIRYSFTG